MIGWLVLGSLVACGTVPPESSIDLTRVRAGFVNDRPHLLRVEGPPTERGTVVERAGLVDMTMRMPADAVLRYRAAGTTLLRPMMLGSDGRIVHLTPEQEPDGTWRAGIPGDPSEPRTLRFLTTAAKSPMWVEPRIVGRAPSAPPVLAAEQRPTVRRPNVILYVVDTLRTDRLSLYGYHRPTSPQLERLAERALVFDNAYAAGSFTSPSITALFSSRYPSEVAGRLAPDGPARQTLAEVLQAAGYQTAGFQANLLCMAELGYGRGFDHYERLKHPDASRVLVDATMLHTAAIDWVRKRDPERPFFLYLQSMDVHYPYRPPPPFRDLFASTAPTAPTPDAVEQTRRLVPDGDPDNVAAALQALSPERYDGAIAYADHSLGMLFATLGRMGLLDDTIVVVTADHGEPLMDRGHMYHGLSVHEELVRVPLVVWLPGVRDGARVPTIVSHLELAPTLVDLAGIVPPAQFLGRSWYAPRAPFQPPAAMGELTRPSTHEAIGWFVREGPWKLIAQRTGDEVTYRLFHLPTDPGETRDVAKENVRLAQHLLTRATERQFIAEPAPVAPPAAVLADDAREEREQALRALGYVE